jgi:tRNA1Val (adenine37-N6)-methyltransferase
MSNSFFQFKQFVIHQDKAAMKVTTDACLFGAVAASFFQNISPQKILDIGTGTGLLSLMLAQAITAQIDAIEVEANAALQAAENCKISKWNKNIEVHHTPIQDFASTTNKKYDAIICNPPFFANQLESPIANRNLAMHQSTLQLVTLFSIVQKLLNKGSLFGILLPYERANESIVAAAEKGLHLLHQVNIKQTDNHHYFRVIQFFTTGTLLFTQEEITIKINNAYSSTFSVLLAPYYLHL